MQGWSLSVNRSRERFATEPSFHVLSITDEHNTSQTVQSLQVTYTQLRQRTCLTCAHTLNAWGVHNRIYIHIIIVM